MKTPDQIHAYIHEQIALRQAGIDATRRLWERHRQTTDRASRNRFLNDALNREIAGLGREIDTLREVATWMEGE